MAVLARAAVAGWWATRSTGGRAGDSQAPGRSSQVVDRVEEVFTQEGFSPATRRVLAAVAHVGYGVSTGAAFGLLRRNTGGRNVEAAVGSSLGVLAWGAGWASWLPLTGVHSPPWEQQTTKVLLPVIDHAVFGAAWGLMFSALTRDRS